MYQARSHMAPDNKPTRIREEIDANLKRVYNEALNEDVPDRLKQLLEELRKKEQEK